MPNVNPSPRVRFQSVPENIKRHRELVTRDDLQTSLDFALLEYQRLVMKTTEPQVAGMGHFKMAGALEFIHAFKTLAEQEQVPEKKDFGKLNYKA
jgi:hypothetical protein